MEERNLSGWLPDRPDHRDFAFRAAAPVALPALSDVSALLNPSPDQGSIGSCVGNATTSAMEWTYRTEKGATIDFSRLFVYWHARRLGGFPTSQDTGCYIRDAMKAAAQLGSCLEATWPYIVTKFSVQPPVAAGNEAAGYQVLLYYRCDGLQAIKTSLGLDRYPVVGGFSVPEGIYSAETSKTGIVRYPGPGEKIVGGHAVIFVGYDDSKRLLKFQNSWGTGWGAGGFGYLPYEFIENGLADDFWTIRNVEIPAPPPHLLPRHHPGRNRSHHDRDRVQNRRSVRSYGVGAGPYGEGSG